jgi:hypothetical protein
VCERVGEGREVCEGACCAVVGFSSYSRGERDGGVWVVGDAWCFDELDGD